MDYLIACFFKSKLLELENRLLLHSQIGAPPLIIQCLGAAHDFLHFLLQLLTSFRYNR